MENNQKPFSFVTYKFYDQKGRRLAIFARELRTIGEFDTEIPKEANSLEIAVFTCSKKDTFSKKEAKKLYSDWLERRFDYTNQEGIAHPEVETIPVSEGKSKVAFINYCNQDFRKIYKAFIPVQFASYKDDTKVVVPHNLQISNTGKMVSITYEELS